MGTNIRNINLTIEINGRLCRADINHPIDLSMPLHSGYPQVNCFEAPYFYASPLRAGDFIGSTAQGSPVNFFNININPHGNGTHTECVGHIATESYFINRCYQPRIHLSQLISIFPQLMDDGDKVIHTTHLESLWEPVGEDALIIRTLPNGDEKKNKDYSNTNPPYLSADAMRYIIERGIQHLLIDLPSVDREKDEGKLSAHKAFWNYPGDAVRHDATITELIFVENSVQDGLYLLNLQLLNLQLDVSPSRPLLYKLL